MPKYLDETGLAHFWDNIKDVTDGLDERVTTLENSVLVVLGDSWSDGSNDPSNTWYMQVSNKLGMAAYVTAAVAGVGFAYGGNTAIPNQVSSALTKVQEAGYSAADVKYVVAFGGVNDYRHSQAYGNVAAGMRTTYDNARTTFPNAEIYLIGPNAGKWNVMDSLDSSSDDKASSYADFPNYIHNIKNNMHNNGYPIVWDAGAWLNYYGGSASALYDSDLLHPTQKGHSVIAGYMCEILLGCYSKPHFYVSDTNRPSDSNTENALMNYSISCDGGVATIQFDMLGNSVVGTDTMVWTLLGNFPLIPGGSSRAAYRAGFVCSNFNWGNLETGYEPIRGYFRPTDRKLTLYPSQTGVLYQVFGTVSLNIY